METYGDIHEKIKTKIHAIHPEDGIVLDEPAEFDVVTCTGQSARVAGHWSKETAVVLDDSSLAPISTESLASYQRTSRRPDAPTVETQKVFTSLKTTSF